MPINTYHQTKLALGSDTTIVLVSNLPSRQIDNTFNLLWLNIFKFESKFSRFLYNSELSVVNRNAGYKTKITSEFAKLLLRAKEMSVDTNYLYNPLILPALQKAGYKQSFVNKYNNDILDDYSNRMVTTVENIQFDTNFITIPFNTALDFGGIGKGYLADEISNLPELNELQGYWISLGGDVISFGLDDTNEPWQIHVQDANKPSSNLKYILNCKAGKTAVASSGTITRKSSPNSKNNWHHIIDPISLKPAKSNIKLATVQASSACEADVYASCAVILGTKKAVTFLKSKGISNMLLQTDGQDNTFAEGDFYKFTSNKSPNQKVYA